MPVAELIDTVERWAIPIGLTIGALVIILTGAGRRLWNEGYEAGKKLREGRGGQQPENRASADPIPLSGGELGTLVSSEPACAADFAATLIESAWLKRVVEVATPEGCYRVEYNGRGIGHESVSVNGTVVCSPTSMLWFVPRFDFRLGGRPAVVEVSVWPWLALRSFDLWIDGQLLYAEN